MKHTVKLAFTHSLDEVGEPVLETIANVLRNDLEKVEPTLVEVLEVSDEEYNFVVVVDSWELGKVTLRENDWEAIFEFEAEFEYVLWDNVYGNDDPPFQQVVDAAITMQDPQVYEAFHPDLNCNLTIVYPASECPTAVLVCALEHALEDSDAQEAE